eukprot:Skav228671  [mRNA]  locus=scaffold1332:376603:381260:- [translate_table: standard]
MSISRAMSGLLGSLESPWRETIRDLIRDELDISACSPCRTSLDLWGQVISIEDNVIHVHVATLEGVNGLQLTESQQLVSLHFENTPTFIGVDDWIGCHGFTVISQVPMQGTPSQDAAMWKIPSNILSGNLLCAHLFAGAFCGWERAVAWDQGSKKYRSIAIDHDGTVLDTWQLQHDATIFRNLEIGFETSQTHFAVWDSIDSVKWFNAFGSDEDLVFTGSPPCQPWSHGGKGQGLHSTNGIAMIHMIRAAWKVRPLALAAECADKTSKHEHFAVIKALMECAGYKLVWTQNVAVHELSFMYRTRWLAVWALLALRVLKVACLFDDQPIMSRVQQCWNERLFADDVVVLRNNDFVFYTPFEYAFSIIRKSCMPHIPKLDISCFAVDLPREFTIRHDASVFDFMLQIGIEAPDCQQIWLFVGATRIEMFIHIGSISNQRFTIQKLGHIIFDGSFHTNNLGAIPTTIVDSCPDGGSDDHEFLRAAEEADPATSAEPNPRLVEFTILTPHSKKVRRVFWPEDISDSQISFRLGFLLCTPTDRSVVPWFQVKHPMPTHGARVIIADQFNDCAAQTCVIVYDAERQMISTSLIGNKAVPPKLLLESWCPNWRSRSAFHNGEPVDPSEPRTFGNGDVLTINPVKLPIQDVSFAPACKKPKTNHDARVERVNQLDSFGPKLGTDEMDFTIKTIRTCSQELIIADPLFVTHELDVRAHEYLFRFCQQVLSRKQSASFPILCEDHWALMEFIWQPDRNITLIKFVNMPSSASNCLLRVVMNVATFLNANLRFTHKVVMTDPGMCGWVIIHRWMRHLLTQFPNAALQLERSFPEDAIQDSSALVIKKIVSSLFLEPEGPPSLREATTIRAVAGWVRQRFFLSLDTMNINPHVKYGGAAGEMQTDNAQDDPWKQNDPWQSYGGGNASVPKQCRWEDLMLPDDHNFFHSTSANSTRIKQVCYVHTSNDIMHKLPAPTYSATVTVMKELVLELHRSVTNKDFFQKVPDHPHESFKMKIREQFPNDIADTAQLYGFRTVFDVDKKTPLSFQILTKASTASRIKMLELSGSADLFVRDYFEKGAEAEDVTILPRFWAVPPPSRDQALRSASGSEGYAGLVVLKRGIAIRGWCSAIAAIRKTVLAADERYNENNWAIIPKIVLESRGWPISLGASDVITAVKSACKQAPIPGRCFRQQGVVTWTLHFATKPDTLRFIASFNGTNHEILLSEPAPCMVTSKGKRGAKGTSKSSNKGPPASSSIHEVAATAHADRLTVLENKMGNMEKRQDQLDNKLNEGFSGVQDQLRQLLQIVQPRQSSPTSTGLSPPPKAPKTS